MPKAKILLIDDEVDLVETVKFRLQMNDYEVMVAYDGEETFQKIEDYKPDLILLDLKLPGMPGEEIYKLLKLRPSTEHIPVILFTASKDDNELAEIGAEDFIQKPFEAKVLLKKIKELLEKNI